MNNYYLYDRNTQIRGPDLSGLTLIILMVTTVFLPIIKELQILEIFKNILVLH